jgi:integrase
MLHKVHGVVIGTCAMLYRWGSIATDPSRRIKGPKRRQVQPVAPTKSQVAALVEAAFAEDGDWGTIVWLLLVTGAQRGEIVRSQLKHVDFERNRLFIDSTQVDEAPRWVALDETTMILLAALRSRIEARLDVAGVQATGRNTSTPMKPTTSSLARPATSPGASRTWVWRSRLIRSRRHCATTRPPNSLPAASTSYP